MYKTAGEQEVIEDGENSRHAPWRGRDRGNLGKAPRKPSEKNAGI